MPSYPSNPKTSSWYSTPQAARKRPKVDFTMDPDAHEKLKVLAEVLEGKGKAVEYLIVLFEDQHGPITAGRALKPSVRKAIQERLTRL